MCLSIEIAHLVSSQVLEWIVIVAPFFEAANSHSNLYSTFDNTMVNTTIPAPIPWHPSPFWDGNDGSWNTFIVQVGTPPQDFRILPSTAGQETWIPSPAGCTKEDPSNPGYCGYLRGTLPVNGVNSSGLETNQTSTWQAIGLYTLDAQEADLGYGGNGDYGLDTVTWGNDSNAPSLTHQVVAGVADPDFWLGVAGLGPKPSNFSNFNEPITSFLSTLVANGSIASLSWGYTAGASYRNFSRASLTLGGYDASRMQTDGLSMNMNEDNSRPLQVGVQKIIGTNTLANTVNLLPTATYHFIDSTLPHIWMPSDSIDAFVSAFGLTYDNNTDLFLVNDTIHSKLLTLNPTITFVFGASTAANSGTTQNIELPYAAFDMKVSYPYYSNATNYFPIRRAANSSQYTIGRTLLQEAYLVADFDRSNFTIAQTAFTSSASSQLIAISRPSATSSSNSSTTSTALPIKPSKISGGAIAGIVVGVIAGLLLIALVLTFILVRRRRARRHHPPAASATSEPTNAPNTPFMSDYEKHTASQRVHELTNSEKAYLHELVATPGASEIGGSETNRWRRSGAQELPTQPIGHESGLLAEAESSLHVFELPGNNMLADVERPQDAGGSVGTAEPTTLNKP